MPSVQNIIPMESDKTTESQKSFGSLFSEMLKQVENTEKTADDQAKKMMLGEVDNVHQVTIASEQAKLTLELAVQVRNKIIDAYQEIMRMQI